MIVDSAYRRLRLLNYDDSFGSSNMSSYLEIFEDDSDPYTETPEQSDKIDGYTERQSQIIKGCLPESHMKVKVSDLKHILKKAEARDDEYVIDQILTNYKELLDKDTYDVPEIDPDVFDEILEMFSSF